tara:strand:+ start:2314 stop:3432 length:1119 start_codon:yes stop_codon:yes gene_type:complete
MSTELLDDFFKFLNSDADPAKHKPFASKKAYSLHSVTNAKLESDHATELQLRNLMDGFETTHNRNRNGYTDVFLDFLDEQKEVLSRRATKKIPAPWTLAPTMFQDERGIEMFLQHQLNPVHNEQNALVEKSAEEWKVPKRFAGFLIHVDKSKWLPFTPARLALASKELHYCVLCGQHYRPVDRFNCSMVSGIPISFSKLPPNANRGVFYALHTDENEIAEVLLHLVSREDHLFYSKENRGHTFLELFDKQPSAFFDMTPRCSVLGEFDNPVSAPSHSIYLNEREWVVNIDSHAEFSKSKKSVPLPGDLAGPLQGKLLDAHLLFKQTVASYIELDKMWGQKENFIVAEKQPRAVPEKYFVPLTITRRFWLISE